MRCTYCDTSYAFHGGTRQSINSIIEQINGYETSYVTITGGEPLAQPLVHELMTALCDLGKDVSLETGNAVDISQVDPRVYIVLDIKTPASNEEQNNLYDNLEKIKPTDALKFVICDEADYRWSQRKVQKFELSKKCEVFFSPSADELSATDLADWIVRDQLPVSMQIQLHKHLWNNEAGR